MESWGWHHGLIGGGLLMGLLWLLVAIVVALLVYRLLRGDRGSATEPGHSSAKQVLQERYARGDIERKEYLEKLRDLER